MRINVEAEWDQLTEDVGGRRVDSIVGKSAGFKNAAAQALDGQTFSSSR